MEETRSPEMEGRRKRLRRESEPGIVIFKLLEDVVHLNPEGFLQNFRLVTFRFVASEYLETRNLS